MKIVLLTFLNLLVFNCIFSQDMSFGNYKDNDPEQLDKVVVTATGTLKKLKDTPVPIVIINQKDIIASNTTTLDEALQKLLPSFSSMTNGMGTTLSLNGLSDTYFVFLLNGKRMDGDNPYSRISLSNIKRVEILSGASAALYGTNAIGGVVNIITDNSYKGIDIMSNTTYRSKNRISEGISVNYNNSKFSTNTHYTYQSSGSWQLSPYEINKKGELIETKKIASVGYRKNSIGQSFGYNISKRLSLNADGSFYDYKTKRPYDVYKYDIHHRNYTLGGGLKYNPGGSNILSLDYFMDNFTSMYDYFKDDKKNNISAGDSEVRKRTRYHNATLKGIFYLGRNHVLSAGGEFLLNTLNSATEKVDNKKAYTMALFAQDEITFSKNFSAIAGLRYMYHQNFKNYATPNASLMYKAGKFNFRATYSSGFRTPTLFELYATGTSTSDRLNLPNPDLKPEKSNYYSLGGEFSNKWLTLSANGFYNRITDMIDFVVIASGDEALENWGAAEVRKRENIAKARVYGINASVAVKVYKDLMINAAYSWINTKDITQKTPIDKSIRNAATFNAQWKHSWNFYALTVNLNGRINGERYSKSYSYAPGYQIWDINTRHSFTFSSFIIEPGIGIENIFDYKDDRPWNNNYSTLNPGRSIYLSLILKFNR